MARVTVTIEGDWAEVQGILARLGEGAPPVEKVAVEAQAEAPARAAEKAEREWTPGQVRRFWRRLSNDARRVLREMAKHPEGISWTALQQALGMRAREVGGTLSSVGHRMRGFAGLPRPVQKITLPEGKGYRLIPSVAKVIASLEE
ncbi:hypothetical protein HRbin23_01214 [bacterium HR23]|nr:hypothetical protein HRbin23_01214 [bacterium HR23]